MSLIEGILGIANELAETHHAASIESIELEIGTLANVEDEAFDFAWKAATPTTVLAHAERIIDHIPATARCLICNQEFEINQYFDECPNCGSFRKEILNGTGVKVKRIILS
ncbi:MAG: hydrogenase maturation nickel metallochaperone HypA [Chitinophagales bacterium]|nr:hydrogenase maturation nickel metallochaperone HypA [Chitinophagales bacterium]